MKVIILNGPPGCGKDTLADHLVYAGVLRNAEKREFKTKLFAIAAVLAGISLGHMLELNRQETKNISSMELPAGRSPRQWLIFVSETLVKPNLGDDYFGQAAADTLTNPEGLYIFADGGFDVELVKLAQKAGKDNILILRLHRVGHSFVGDSRNYLDPNIAGTTLGVKNNGSKTDFLNDATNVVTAWLNS